MAKQRTKLCNCCTSILFLSQPITTLLVLSQHQAVQAPQSNPWYSLFDFLRGQILHHLLYSSLIE